MTRSIWLVAGLLSLALGIAGIFLPLLPTVPFLLLATLCFGRSSPRLHHWLITHPRLGPPIQDWQTHGAISRRAKWMASLTFPGAPVLSWWLGFSGWVIAVQCLALMGVATFIWTRPDR
ncbi:MAG: YbaN family protein [Paracoccaceae bacterium]